MSKVVLRDLVDTDKIVTVYGVSKKSTSVKVRRVKLNKVNDYWYGPRIKLSYYDKNDKISSASYINNDEGLRNSYYAEYNGYIYYLDVKKAHEVVVSNIRAQKRELDKKQMDVQRILARYE